MCTPLAGVEAVEGLVEDHDARVVDERLAPPSPAGACPWSRWRAGGGRRGRARPCASAPRAAASAVGRPWRLAGQARRTRRRSAPRTPPPAGAPGRPGGRRRGRVRGSCPRTRTGRCDGAGEPAQHPQQVDLPAPFGPEEGGDAGADAERDVGHGHEVAEPLRDVRGLDHGQVRRGTPAGCRAATQPAGAGGGSAHGRAPTGSAATGGPPTVAAARAGRQRLPRAARSSGPRTTPEGQASPGRARAATGGPACLRAIDAVADARSPRHLQPTGSASAGRAAATTVQPIAATTTTSVGEVAGVLPRAVRLEESPAAPCHRRRRSRARRRRPAAGAGAIAGRPRRPGAVLVVERARPRISPATSSTMMPTEAKARRSVSDDTASADEAEQRREQEPGRTDAAERREEAAEPSGPRPRVSAMRPSSSSSGGPRVTSDAEHRRRTLASEVACPG